MTRRRNARTSFYDEARRSDVGIVVVIGVLRLAAARPVQCVMSFPRRCPRTVASCLVVLTVLGAILSSTADAQDGPRIVAVRADPLTVDEGDVVALEVEATHPNDAPMRYGWEFGNGAGLDPEPSARRTFTAYLDDGEFDVVVAAEDADGRTDDATVRVTVRNVAPRIRGVDRDGATLEKHDVTFRSRVADPGDDELSYAWDFGDGTVLGPGRTLDLAQHAYDAAGSYRLTLTVDDGDGGTATWTETIVVGAGLRFSASGAVSVEDGDGESPYLMGLPVVRDGQLIRFAGDLGAAARGSPAADAGAPCLVSFGSRAPTIASGLEEGTVVRFGGLFPNGLHEGTYPVAVVRNELPFQVYETFEREWARPDTFFVYVESLELVDDAPQGQSFHGSGGSVAIQLWEDGRIEATFTANLEETLGALDLLDTPGPPQLRPAATAQVRGTFAHEIQRSLTGGSGSLNALAGASYGDWYVCAPREPLTVEETVPSPDAATAAGAGRDVPLIGFEDPELTVRFSRPVDLGSAVENVVLEWRRADGNFEEVPILVIGESDDTLRLAPLDDLMDGVVYRARIVGGLQGVEGRGGEVLDDDEEWRFETVVDLSEDRNGVTVATTQVARDAPLVAGKPTETRVYLNWREKPHVHPEWQTRYTTFSVEVEGGDYAPQRVRAKRMDLYGPVEKKYALDSVNFYGWEPGSGSSHALTARATQLGQVGPERSFEGSWTAAGYGDAPALTFDYHFVRVGSWADGVPLDARRLGHRIARHGASFTEQTFPVPDVIARYRGDVVIEEPDEPILEAMGEEFYLSSLATASRRDEVLVGRYAERLGATDADVVVAFLPPDVLRLSGFAYHALGTDPRVVAVQVDTAQEAADRYFASTVAHEIGHTFGLDHDSDCPSASVQACIDVGRSDAIEGTRIAAGGASGWNKSKWSGNAEVGRTPGVVLSLMHPANLPDDAVFVTNEDYQQLMGALNTLASRLEPDAWLAGTTSLNAAGGLLRVQDERVPGLRVAGAIDVASGRAVLTSIVPATAPAAGDATETELDGPRLEARSPSGDVLATVAIEPTPPDRWHAPASAGTLRPFEAFLPAAGPVASVEVIANGRTLSDRRASARPPQLSVDVATIDATVPVRLTWTATDPDGDGLRFDVDYAPDGRDWRPLAVGLGTSSLELSPDALPPGVDPTIRIVANDGMRAAAAEVSVIVSAAPRVLATDPSEHGETPPRLRHHRVDPRRAGRDRPRCAGGRARGRARWRAGACDRPRDASTRRRWRPPRPRCAPRGRRELPRDVRCRRRRTGRDPDRRTDVLVVSDRLRGAGARDSGPESDRSAPAELRGRPVRPGGARRPRGGRRGRHRAARALCRAAAIRVRPAPAGRRHRAGGR